MIHYQYTMRVRNGLQNLRFKLLESMTAQQLVDYSVSNLTQKFLGLRVSDKNASNDISVIEADYSKTDNTFTIYFEATPTYGKTATVFTPNGTTYPGTFYNILLKFINVDLYLTEKMSNDELLNMMKNCDVLVHSNDASYYFQGVWEDLDDTGNAAFKFPGPKGDGVWRQKHSQSGGLRNSKIRVTKHLAQVLENLDSFIPQVKSKLRVI